MDVRQTVRSHYSGKGLAGVVLTAVAASGADLAHLRPDDLGSVDQLHLGGAAATAHLLRRLRLSPETPLIDVGGGLGGPARAAAHGWGCPVVSVDLSPDFVEAAQALTARVLADGGLFGLFEQVRTGPGELTYPLPWAAEESSSFLVDLPTTTGALTAAGFVVEEVEDRTAAVPEVATPAPGPSPLSPATVFGPGFAERLRNDRDAIRAGLLAPVVVLARAT
jgi:MPBQ/MSBQ methyltransferase